MLPSSRNVYGSHVTSLRCDVTCSLLSSLISLAARRVLNNIDLDPASSEAAQTSVAAVLHCRRRLGAKMAGPRLAESAICPQHDRRVRRQAGRDIQSRNISSAIMLTNPIQNGFRRQQRPLTQFASLQAAFTSPVQTRL